MMLSSRLLAGPALGLSLAAVAALPLGAVAQNYDIKSFHGHTPTSDELIESLKPSPPPEGIKFRGVRPVQAAKPKAVALSIQFEFGSAQLTSEAKTVLDNLGTALKSPDLSANIFLIEGHTDSVGSDEYNQRLSEARATSVKTYLTSTLGVQPSRLETAGKGEAQPLDASNTEAAVNRRVQIVNVR
ncbi:MAG: OmpA family protein [Gammaproteobacteria bacterium]|jgi:outer membrane protein OmpA-like peptidoglycan-associated protein|nr:OmpA family protein [Gammaproteobacteria bacterium]